MRDLGALEVAERESAGWEGDGSEERIGAFSCQKQGGGRNSLNSEESRLSCSWNDEEEHLPVRRAEAEILVLWRLSPSPGYP